MPRVLVVAPNWIGDALMAQPLLSRLRDKLPGARIEVLAPEWVAPVARRMPEVDEVMSLQQEIEQAIFRVLRRLVFHLEQPLFAHHFDTELDEVAHHRLDIAPDVADFGELGGFDLEKGRLRQPREPAGDLGLAHAGGTNHQDVLGCDFIRELGRELLPPSPVA